MLNPEAAQAQLKQLFNPDWRSQHLQQIAKLPPPLAAVGYGLLGHNEDGRSGDYTQTYQYQEKALQALEELSDSDRLQIFSILFPKFSDTVELAWQLHNQLPYQQGYSRRSFRVPHNPELNQAKRGQWLTQLIEAIEGYEQELEWFADWVPYLTYGAPDALGILFAAAINRGDTLGQTILQILLDSARAIARLAQWDDM